MAEKDTTPDVAPADNKTGLILTVIIVALIVFGVGYKMTKKGGLNPSLSPISTTTHTPGPINGLSCEYQYYNPVIGFVQYYLSTEGVDVSTTKNVTCDFSVVVNDKEVAKATGESPLTEKPQRGGSTFRCTTKAIDLEPDVPATVNVLITNDQGNTATCSANFIFPKP